MLCVAGLIIAWKIRKLRYSVYNESKIIAFSVSLKNDTSSRSLLTSFQMYNAAFFATLVIVLQFTQATERDLLYILRSAGIMLGTGTQTRVQCDTLTPEINDLFNSCQCGHSFRNKVDYEP